MPPMGNSPLASWLVAAALGVAVACANASSAMAESAPPLRPISLYNLYDGDSPDPTPDGAKRIIDAARRFVDAATKASAPGRCPIAKITVIVKKNDPPLDLAIAAARRASLQQILYDQARYLEFEADDNGTRDEVRVEYYEPRDTKDPELEVIWTPPKGTKVRAGQQIKAVATARDHSNFWETGIKRIDLIALPVEAERSFGFQDYTRPPLQCEGLPPPQTIEGVYTVPSDAPPIVRLRASAQDFAGNGTNVNAEFPTGDWYGRIEWTHVVMWGELFPYRLTRGSADLSLADDSGRLTGRLVGTHWRTGGTTCTDITTARGRLEATLSGSYNSVTRAMTISVSDRRTTRMEVMFSCIWGMDFDDRPILYALYEEALRNLSPPVDDGYHTQGQRTDASEPNVTTTIRYSLTLRRAGN